MKEPFLINPIRKKFRRDKIRRIRRVKTSLKKRLHKISGRSKTMRRRRRRNPMEELMIMNDPARRRRHKRVRRVGGRKHKLSVSGRRGRLTVSRRSRLAPGSRGSILNPLLPRMGAGVVTQVVATAVGFTVVRMLPKYVLPVDWQTGWKGYAGKVGSVIVATAVTGVVFKRRPDIKRAVLVGGLLSIGLDLLSTVLPGVMAGSVGIIVPESAVRGLGIGGRKIITPMTGEGMSNESTIDEHYA
jgi:hypothetical protein